MILQIQILRKKAIKWALSLLLTMKLKCLRLYCIYGGWMKSISIMTLALLCLLFKTPWANSEIATNGTNTNRYTYTNKYNCKTLDKNQMALISRDFNHNPFQMVESLVRIANGDYSEAMKNLSIGFSFDLNMVYLQTIKLDQKSNFFKNSYMTKVKTNFFGLYHQLYKKPTQSLTTKHSKSLSALDTKKLKSGSISFTSLSQTSCTKEETQLLGCKNGYYVLDAIISPEISCKKNDLKHAFKTKFYLTHSQKYGFKVTDVEMSGVRIMLQTFQYAQELKKRGWKKDSILARFKNIQNTSSSFKFPSKLNHSKSIMAIIESNNNNNRIPTSL